MSVPYLLLTSALAAPPLVVAAEEAGSGLRAWAREGDLLIATAAGASGPIIRPLSSSSTVSAPATFEDWSDLFATCDGGTLQSTRPNDGHLLVARAAALNNNVGVELEINRRVVASAKLERPAVPCHIMVGNVDQTTGLELIVSWRTPSGVSGVTAYRIPATVIPADQTAKP